MTADDSHGAKGGSTSQHSTASSADSMGSQQLRNATKVLATRMLQGYELTRTNFPRVGTSR